VGDTGRATGGDKVADCATGTDESGDAASRRLLKRVLTRGTGTGTATAGGDEAGCGTDGDEADESGVTAATGAAALTELDEEEEELDIESNLVCDRNNKTKKRPQKNAHFF
jgi:hypothetical protein